MPVGPPAIWPKFSSNSDQLDSQYGDGIRFVAADLFVSKSNREILLGSHPGHALPLEPATMPGLEKSLVTIVWSHRGTRLRDWFPCSNLGSVESQAWTGGGNCG